MEMSNAAERVADFLDKCNVRGNVEFEAIMAAIEIGRNLHTVEKQIRPQLLAQMRNKSIYFAKSDMPIAALITHTVVTAWEGNPPNMWRKSKE